MGNGWLNYNIFCLLQPGIEPGDVVVILQQQPHQLFKRQGDDLYLTHTITPTEAKCGFSHVLKVLILHRLPSVWLYVLFFLLTAP